MWANWNDLATGFFTPFGIAGMLLFSIWTPTIVHDILTPLSYSLANLQVRLNPALALYFPRGSGLERHSKVTTPQLKTPCTN